MPSIPSKKIVTIPDPVLQQHASEIPVEKISSRKIQQIRAIMSEALRKTTEGIGIAAPQVGYSLRMFLASEEALRWYDQKETEDIKDKKEWAHYTFINPVIKSQSKKKISDTEGCLSVPGIYGTVERAEKVIVEAYDEQGKKFQRGMTKLYARVMQHEIDHLNGILFIDKAKNIKHISTHKK